MPRRLAFLGAVLVLAMAVAAAADPPVVVAEASATYLFSFFTQLDHSPTCWIPWSHASTDGPAFHELHDSLADPWCPVLVLAHCDRDSFAFRSMWPYVEEQPNPYWFRHLELDATLTCVLTVTGSIDLTARREQQGLVDEIVQTLDLTRPGGSSEILLGTNGEPDQATVTLAPGGHVLTLHYRAAHDGEWPAFAGSVAVTWTADATPVQNRRWADVKSLYR